MLPRLLAAGVSLAAVYGCVAEFKCTEDSNCDLKVGGRCVAGTCQYDGDTTTGTDASSVPGSSTDPTASTDPGPATDPGSSTDPASPTSSSTSTDGSDTEAPVGCDEWDVVFKDDRGKATGLALAADGGAFLVGVSHGTMSAELRVKRLTAAGGELWTVKVADTDDINLDADNDLWPRAFLLDPAGDQLRVVYTRRIVNDMDVSVKTGPFIRHVAVDDGALLPIDDTLIGYYQSIRGVVMPDADTLLLAGERKDNIWYQRATLGGGMWTPTWDAWPESFAPAANYQNTAITQAIAPLAAGVLVGGTWDEVPLADEFSGWLRRLAVADGAVPCDCAIAQRGVMAMAPAADGSMFVTGFEQADGQSQLWLARLDPACPLVCTSQDDPGSSLAWERSEPGAATNTNYSHAEFFEDTGMAITPLGDGGVIVAGTLDDRPWIGRYSADGTRDWELARDRPGAALALAASPDERCLTIAGSDDYGDFEHRLWWARRVKLPE